MTRPPDLVAALSTAPPRTRVAGTLCRHTGRMARSPTDHRAEAHEPELWKLTLPAVRAAGAAANAQLEGGGWRPRVSLPRVGVFDSGWPHLNRSTLFPPDDAPTDYSALFGATGGNLNPIAYADVPELVTLIDYVRAREDLRSRTTVRSATGNVEREDRLLEFEVADLPLSLLDRARATDAGTDDELLALYLERERAWLLDPLPVEYIFPLALTALDLDAVLVIDDFIRVEPLDAAMQAARAPSVDSMGSVPTPVVSAATHAIVVSGHQLKNLGPAARNFDRYDEPLPLEEADLVCEALRIVTHLDVGYAQVLRRPLGWADLWVHDLPAVTTLSTMRRYPDWFDRYRWLREPNPISRPALEQLPAVVAALRAAAANVRLAARRLSLAATRSASDDRTVDACIGLEALLGDGRDELSHRLALRAATVLATRAVDPADPHTIYDLIKKVYKHRSAVVHGTTADKSRTLTFGGSTYAAADVAIILLREMLTDALTRSGGWTPKSLDAELLTALAQNATSSGTTRGAGGAADY